MAYVKTSGIVIKQVNYGDNDKIVTLFTKDNGKIQAIIKGARKTKGKFIASSQMFTYSNFVYYQSKSFANIYQAELIQSFFNLHNDLLKLAYASYIAELINISFEEGEKDERVLSLLLHSLYYISENKCTSYEVILLTFQLKIMGLLGYAPHLSECITCSNKSEEYYFNNSIGGIVCKKCNPKDSFDKSISSESAELMKFLLYEPLKKIIKIEKINQETLYFLINIMNSYISLHLDKKLYTYDFINSIK